MKKHIFGCGCHPKKIEFENARELAEYWLKEERDMRTWCNCFNQYIYSKAEPNPLKTWWHGCFWENRQKMSYFEWVEIEKRAIDFVESKLLEMGYTSAIMYNCVMDGCGHGWTSFKVELQTISQDPQIRFDFDN